MYIYFLYKNVINIQLLFHFIAIIMKLLILLLITICIVATFADDEADWQAFKMQFGKLFLSKGKEAKRRAAFKKHKATIDELKAAADAGEITYEPKMYAFHDLEPQEIKARLTGLKSPETQVEYEEVSVETRQTPPTNYDSRTVIPFNPPKDQGQCGMFL